MYSYGSPHTAAQKQDDQHERTFSSYVRIQVVVLKTYLGRWTIGRSGERGSGISVLPARYDDDDEATQAEISGGSDLDNKKAVSAVPCWTDWWFPLFLLQYETMHCPVETQLQVTLEKASSSSTLSCVLSTEIHFCSGMFTTETLLPAKMSTFTEFQHFWWLILGAWSDLAGLIYILNIISTSLKHLIRICCPVHITTYFVNFT